jgi:class 3 adenylate cyclase
MFADIVGFTRMTEEISPVETVKMLNDVFSVFDELADKHRVEKIKTIGDAYMAAAGLDTGANIHYADAVASMALEMLQKLEEYRRRTGERLQIRIGIGTGPVVAGVIGKKKFIYDMWGDTVNVAFRLAADAPAETIRVDLMTHRRLHSRFQFDAAQEVEIKGKGRMQVFELKGALARASAVARQPEDRLPKRAHPGALGLDLAGTEPDPVLVVERRLVRAPAHREVCVGGAGRERRVEQPQLAAAIEQRVVALVLAQPRMRRPVQQDQRLDAEFEVDHAARGVLELPAFRLVLRAHAVAHRDDVVEELLALARRGEDSVAHALEALAGRPIPGARASPRGRLVLPGPCALLLVVAEGG